MYRVQLKYRSVLCEQEQLVQEHCRPLLSFIARHINACCIDFPDQTV